MKDDNKRKVAKGSTLFRTKNEKIAIKKSRVIRLKNKTERDAKKKFIKPVKIELKTYPDEKNINLIIRFLFDNGVRIKDYKERYILRRIRARVSKNRCKSYLDYHKLLISSKKEYRELIESLSINVTRFFRNRDTYEFVKNNIIPIIIQNSSKNKIKMWSAGCAVGAEAYSMAMLMDGLNDLYSITATDIKQELLNLAKGALYDKIYLAEMTPKEKRIYFNSVDENTSSVKGKYKMKVKFSILNLLKDKYPIGLDMIFCRNVLIYIDREPQDKIINGFIKSLNPGGFLVLGRTESIFNKRLLNDLNVYNTRHRIYQKTRMNELKKE
jgi:chemotaxis protein methyltransferase CheR